LPLEWLSQDLEKFLRKVHWSLHYGSTPFRAQEPQIVGMKSANIAHCPHIVDPDFKPWAAHFKRVAIKTALAMAPSFSKEVSFPLARIAVRMLKNSDYIFVKFDKAHGYACIHRRQAHLLYRSALPESCYTPVSVYHCGFRAMEAQARALAQRLQCDADQPGLAFQIISRMAAPIPSAVGFTIKSHKPAGEVTFRTLHRSSKPALSGFSKWIAAILKPAVEELPHVVKDSYDFKSKLEAIPLLPPDAKMLTIDLKDFFLSGDFQVLAEDAAEMVPAKADLLKEVVGLVLNNQFVLPAGLEELHKCSKGSGMGLSHSGHLANSSFYVSVEKPFFNTNPKGLLCWLRFFDGILAKAC